MAATSFYGLEVDRPARAEMADMLAVFDVLKPKASATPLVRIGGDRDGSYLVPGDDLEGITACFSPGANKTKFFEDYLTDQYGISSHMCDFSCTVDQFHTPLREGKQTFVKKWLDVTADEDNIVLADWIQEQAPTGDLLLQMDIEGAEYRNILAASDETLARFRVMVLEIHGLGRMTNASVLGTVIGPFFAKLARNFTTVHAHPNNCCGDFTIPGTDVRVPNILELTLVRHDRFRAAPGVPELPHRLDIGRNVSHKPPLFLSDAWVDYQRPLESRVRMLEETQQFAETSSAADRDNELADVLGMTMRSLQTIRDQFAARSRGGSNASDAELIEVAHGRRYVLSSALGATSRTGVVRPRGYYFFHTDFEPKPSIRVDLGEPMPIRRIELANRLNGFQWRAKYVFAVLSTDDGPQASQSVYPIYADGPLAKDAWKECGVDLPDVRARFVTITTPLNTALHLSDLRIYAATGALPDRGPDAATLR